MEPRKLASRIETRRRRIGRFSDGSDAQELEETRHVVTVAHNLGVDEIEFDHDPTDDEIISALPNPPAVRPSTLAQRVERVAELAQAWQALKAAAADTTAFTALERSRLDTAAGLVAGRIKGLL